jgi:hypothetical protein
MRLRAFVTAACLAATPSFALDIGGSYFLQGVNPDGTEYTGTVEIVPISDVTCAITWTTEGETATGICMRYHNAFAAAYELDDAVGLLIYEILPDKTMEGTWTIAGEDGVGVEQLIPR